MQTVINPWREHRLILVKNKFIMKKIIFLLFATYCFALPTAFSQSEGAPITIKASPSIAVSGKPIEFGGNTIIAKHPLPVALRLHAPDGSTVDLETITDNKGDFKLTYLKAFATGQYIINAKTADGKGLASDTFVIATITGAANDLQNNFFKSTQAVQKSLNAIIESVTKLPASPDLDAQKEKLEAYAQKLSTLKSDEEKLALALKELIKATMGVPIPDTYLKDISTDNKKIMETLPALEAKAAQLKNKSEICETINNMIEVCGFISLVLDFKTKVLKTLAKNLISDKLIPGGLDRYITKGTIEEKETTKLKINTAQKTALAATDGAAGLSSFVGTGLSLDLCSYIGKIIYARYCDELKGDFVGGFKGTFQADNGLAWWKYDLDVKGEVKLRYKKETDFSKGAEISGDFIGYRVRYGVYEDFEQVEKIPTGMQLYKKFVISPAVLNLNKYNDDIGAIATAYMPGAFRVKVKGTVNSKNELRLIIDNSASFGIDKVENNTLWIILLNKMLPIPVIKKFAIPIATDRVIFTTMLKDQVFKLVQEKENVMIEVNNNKTRIPLGTVVVDAKLTMSLKNKKALGIK